MNGEIMPTVASIRQMDVFLALPFGPETQTKRRGDENFNVMARLKALLGPKASGTNDENLLVIRDAPGVSGAYATNIMSVYNQYRISVR